MWLPVDPGFKVPNLTVIVAVVPVGTALVATVAFIAPKVPDVFKSIFTAPPPLSIVTMVGVAPLNSDPIVTATMRSALAVPIDTFE